MASLGNAAPLAIIFFVSTSQATPNQQNNPEFTTQQCIQLAKFIDAAPSDAGKTQNLGATCASTTVMQRIRVFSSIWPTKRPTIANLEGFSKGYSASVCTLLKDAISEGASIQITFLNDSIKESSIITINRAWCEQEQSIVKMVANSLSCEKVAKGVELSLQGKSGSDYLVVRNVICKKGLSKPSSLTVNVEVQGSEGERVERIKSGISNPDTLRLTKRMMCAGKSGLLESFDYSEVYSIRGIEVASIHITEDDCKVFKK